MSSHSASEASGEGSVNGRFDSKYVTRTFDADRVDESLNSNSKTNKLKSPGEMSIIIDKISSTDLCDYALNIG